MKPKKAISSKRTSRAVTKSQKKNSESPETTQATDAWLVRPDALDLLVKTVVSMPSVFASFDEDFKEPQNDLGDQSEVKPLDVHVNWAAHLIVCILFCNILFNKSDPACQIKTLEKSI